MKSKDRSDPELLKPRPSRCASLQEIADACGCSRMTVSRALRNDPKCAEATAAAIRDVAATLNYRPNPLVVARMEMIRAKAHQRNETLAILYQGVKKDGWKEHANSRRWIKGMQDRASLLGFETTLIELPCEPEAINQQLRVLAYRRVTGLCLLPFIEANSTLNVDLLADFSSACIGYTIVMPVLHRVVSDHRKGMLIALDKLQQAGYQRIGVFLEMKTSERIAHRQLEAYLGKFYFTQSGMIPPLVLPGETTPEAYRKAFKNWIKQHQPDVVLSNLPPLPFYHELGIGDPARIGFACLDLTDSKPHGISGIDQEPEKIGATVIDRVISQLYCNERGVPSLPELTLIPPTWVKGRTTQACL